MPERAIPAGDQPGGRALRARTRDVRKRSSPGRSDAAGRSLAHVGQGRMPTQPGWRDRQRGFVQTTELTAAP
jgi:hypothetical protein